MRMPAELVRCDKIKAVSLRLAEVVYDAVPRKPKDPSRPWPYCTWPKSTLKVMAGLTEKQWVVAVRQLAALGFVEHERHPTNVNLWRFRLLKLPPMEAKERFAEWSRKGAPQGGGVPQNGQVDSAESDNSTQPDRPSRVPQNGQVDSAESDNQELEEKPQSEPDPQQQGKPHPAACLLAS